MDNFFAYLHNFDVVATSCATGAPDPRLDSEGNGSVSIPEQQHGDNSLLGLVYQPSTGQFVPAD